MRPNSDLIITNSALLALKDLLAGTTLKEARLEEITGLIRDNWGASILQVDILELSRFMHGSDKSISPKEDAQLLDLDLESTICQPYHGGLNSSIYNHPEYAILPYEANFFFFITALTCAGKPCAVIWSYWNPCCWLMITDGEIAFSKTAAEGSAFSSLHLDRIIYALSLVERRKKLGVKGEPALYIFMDHIGHHLWHELTPIFSFSKVIADARSPRAAIAAAKMVMSHSRPEDQDEIPIFTFDGADFEACEKLAIEYNIIPSKSMNVSRRIADIFFSSISKRLQVETPSFLSFNASTLPSLRGCPESEAIIFSLRCGNRMLTTTESFFSALQTQLLESSTIRTIYITGFNADFGKYAFQEFIPGSSPSDQERNLAQSLCSLAQEPMRVISLVGAPLMDDLAAAACCRAVISPWGASLSKYCWALRLPVIFFSNSEMTSGKSGERDIYHRSDYIEDPSCGVCISDVPIVDEGEGMGWLPNARSNFTIDSVFLARSVVCNMNKIVKGIKG